MSRKCCARSWRASCHYVLCVCPFFICLFVYFNRKRPLARPHIQYPSETPVNADHTENKIIENLKGLSCGRTNWINGVHCTESGSSCAAQPRHSTRESNGVSARFNLAANKRMRIRSGYEQFRPKFNRLQRFSFEFVFVYERCACV